MSKRSRSILKQRSEHIAGTYECLAPAFVRTEASSLCTDQRQINPGEKLELTKVTVVPAGEDGVVYAQLENDGGWIRIEKDDGSLVVKLVENKKQEEAESSSMVSLGKATPISSASMKDTHRASSPDVGIRRSLSPSTSTAVGSPPPLSPKSPSRNSSILPSKTAKQIEGQRKLSLKQSEEGQAVRAAIPSWDMCLL
jgi:hypothetical protein